MVLVATIALIDSKLVLFAEVVFTLHEVPRDMCSHNIWISEKHVNRLDHVNST